MKYANPNQNRKQMALHLNAWSLVSCRDSMRRRSDGRFMRSSAFDGASTSMVREAARQRRAEAARLRLPAALPAGSADCLPPAWLVGSTTATRTAFRVLWRPIRAAISVNFGRLSHVSGLIERECQDASIKPLTWGSGPLLTKIGVFPLGCPDTLVWGARAAKSPGTV